MAHGGPFTFANDLGIELCCTQLGPSLMTWHLKQSLDRAHGRRFCNSHMGEVGRASRACVDFLKGSLRSLVAKGDYQGYGILAAVAGNAYWTPGKLVTAGYLCEQACEHCGAPIDDAHHRVWECPYSAEARLGVSELTWSYLEQLPRGSPQAMCGVLPHLGDCAPKPPAEGACKLVRYDGKPMDCWDMHGGIFIDGSCSRPCVKDLARAAWAVLAFDRWGALQAKLTGPVWAALPQTSQSAEHCAYAACSQVAAGPSAIFSDCATVVHAAAMPVQHRIEASRRYAGVLRHAALQTGAAHILATFKVKAHQDIRLVEEPCRAWAAVNNCRVDEAAKEEMAFHNVQEQVDIADGHCEVAKQICSTTVKALRLWPKMQSFPPRPLAAGGPCAQEGPRCAWGRAHDWQCCGGGWRCKTCFAVRAHPNQAACKGPPTALLSMLQDDTGPRIFAFDDSLGGNIYSCASCSCWTAGKRLVRLGTACPGRIPWCGRTKAQAAAASVLKRLWQDGRHPDPKRKAKVILSSALAASLNANTVQQDLAEGKCLARGGGGGGWLQLAA